MGVWYPRENRAHCVLVGQALTDVAASAGSCSLRRGIIPSHKIVTIFFSPTDLDSTRRNVS